MRRAYKPRSIRRQESKHKRKLIFSLVGAALFVYVFFVWLLPMLIGGLSVINQKPIEKQKSAAEDVKLAPPVFNIPFESTNSATISVNGFSRPNSKVEIFLNSTSQGTVNSDGDGKFQTTTMTLSIGENYIYGKTIDDKGVASFNSKPIRIIYSDEKPKLEVSEPSNGQEIQGDDKKVKVSGTTNPGNIVTINGTISIVNSDGKFSSVQSLNDGENEILINATNNVGNATEIKLKVIFKPNSSSPVNP